MDVLSLEQLRASKGRRTQTVDLKEFGLEGVVIVGKLSVAERDKFALASQDKSDRLKGLATLLEVGLLQPRMTYDEARQLCDCDADMVDVVITTILEFNGMTKEASDKLKRSFPEESRPEVPVPASPEAA